MIYSKMQSVEAEFLAKIEDIEPYRGKWLAILDSKIIAVGDDIKEVYKEAMTKSKGRTPLFNRIPVKGETEHFIL